MNQHVLQILRESMIRRWVQHGKVEQIKTINTRDLKEELIVIKFQGVNLYCKKEDFIDREVLSFNGFMHTEVPFVVNTILEDENIVLVSRREAIPKVVQQFHNTVRKGDVVKGIVTGVLDNNLVFLNVNGFPCLIPQSEWDIRRIRKLKEVLPVGTEVEAQVLDIIKEEPFEAAVEPVVEEKIKKLTKAEKAKQLEDAQNEEELEDTEDPEEQKILEERKTSSQEFGYRVVLSRRVLILENKEQFWEDIENHHREGDKVAVTVTGKTAGNNSYFCELPTGVTFIGHLNTFMRRKYLNGLTAGMKCHAEIIRIDKEKKRGNLILFRLEANNAAMMSNVLSFN